MSDMQKKIKVSSPGSLMLFGEHAVLHGNLAIVAAIDKRIEITLIPRDDKNIKIISTLGEFSTTINSLEIKRPFEFVLTTIKKFLQKNKLALGFNLEIKSEFSHQLGFGSSAAVIAGTIAALNLYHFAKLPDFQELLSQGFDVINNVQGIGSGADLAASIYGGIIAYRMENFSVTKIANNLPLIAIYSGKKVPTKEVIAMVANSRQKYPKIFAKLFSAINQCSIVAVDALKQQNWPMLGELMNINAGLQDALGVSDADLSKIIYQLRQEPSIFGAKISGSGLGDCLIALGNLQQKLDYQVIPVNIENQGIVLL